MSSEKTFRIALVGCGRISKNHFEAIEQIDGLDLVAVCDADPERAAQAGAQWNVPHYSSFEKMLKESKADVITIATPSGLHAEQGVAAAQAGKHVVMEKPMAISLTGADALVHACDKAGVQLFVVKQNRLNLPVQLLKRAVDRNRFGRIYMASCTVHWARPQEYYDQAPWRGTWEFDGGAFMNQASHYVDLIQWLMGPVESVMAKTATLARRIETEDS
ncbi:MAG TPA: oxidoreductase, partial [Gemmatimonadetes bacterium]|nr:oxidoreductase [Gemmatimonadota bacterium]